MALPLALVLAPAEVYPRVCGGTRDRPPPDKREWGLSPRVRGNPGLQSLRAETGGSIPACAGEPAGGTSPAA